MSSTTTTTKTLFITSVSSGFGRALTQAAATAEHTVVGTLRDTKDAEEIQALDGRSHAQAPDVIDGGAVAAAVARAEHDFRPIDVLVANAGYGHEGTLEESTMVELRRQSEVNVFGAVATIKAALPRVRQRRSGHVIGITSMGGLMTIPGLTSTTAASSRSRASSAPWPRRSTHSVSRSRPSPPGSFRAEWTGRSMVRAASQNADYEPIFAPLRAARGHQLADPGRAAQVMLELMAMDTPPVHLLLGSDAIRLVAEDRAHVDDELTAWTELSRSTDFTGSAQIASP